MSAPSAARTLLRALPLRMAASVAYLAVSACVAGSTQERRDGPSRTDAGAPPAAVEAPATAPPPTASIAPAPPEAPAPAQTATTHESAALPPTPADASHDNQAKSEKMLPPCVPVRRAHVKHHKAKQSPPPEQPPQPPPQPPPADAVVDARVGEVDTSVSSILGKEVKSPKGEDLGRVVDVLADAEGHVRVAIIDFGGFLGVGTRRIAVDWPLLRFDPGAHDKALVLSVTREKLQSAPEYKDTSKPRVLMPPAAPDASNAGQANH